MRMLNLIFMSTAPDNVSEDVQGVDDYRYA